MLERTKHTSAIVVAIGIVVEEATQPASVGLERVEPMTQYQRPLPR